MLKRASIIFMNRGPIEARFPFLNPDVCEYMLSIDKKWLQLSPTNAEVLLNLLDKKRLNNLEKLKETIHSYLANPELFNKNPEDYAFDLKKIFWKLLCKVMVREWPILIMLGFHEFLPFYLIFAFLSI